MAKGKGGFIGHDGLNAPDEPTNVSGTAGDTQVDVSFTSPTDVGGSAITSYLVTDSTKAHTATGSSSPVTVTGLTNGTSYTFNVWAINAFGWSVASDASDAVTPAAAIAVFGGGNTAAGNSNVLQSVSISSLGNTTDFGDLDQGTTTEMAACASSTRGLFGGGIHAGSRKDSISYITFASAGNSVDFGNLTVARNRLGSCGSSTRGLFGGGTNGSDQNVVDYVTIASTGNATDFGDLTSSRSRLAAASSSTRGLFIGGDGVNTVDYVTIATTGNATDFGDLLTTGGLLAACSGSGRAVAAGGQSSDVIQYFTIATTGNATDFGDLTAGETNQFAGASSSTRGLFGGGEVSFTQTNAISYITILSTGNSSDFGDLLAANSGISACSSAHGGLA